MCGSAPSRTELHKGPLLKLKDLPASKQTEVVMRTRFCCWSEGSSIGQQGPLQIRAGFLPSLCSSRQSHNSVPQLLLAHTQWPSHGDRLSPLWKHNPRHLIFFYLVTCIPSVVEHLCLFSPFPPSTRAWDYGEKEF